MKNLSFAVVALGLIQTSIAWSAPTPISCPQKSGEEISVNNDQVMQWKKNSEKEFIRTRVHIVGKVIKVLPPMTVKNPAKEPDKFRAKHLRLQVNIGGDKKDFVEVFFNGRYPRPTLKKGDSIEACGEFVADATNTKARPAFAVIYWVHAATLFPHPEGYLNTNGKTFGRTVAEK